MDSSLFVTRDYIITTYVHYASYVADATAVLLCVRDSREGEVVTVTAGHDMTRLVCIALPGVQWRGIIDVRACTQQKMSYALYADCDSSIYVECIVTGVHVDMCEVTSSTIGAGADIQVMLRYCLHADRALSIRTVQTHAVANSSSLIDIKGILFGASSVDFEGSIVVLAAGKQTTAQLMHKGLLLSSAARATGKPQLEVHTPDVLCKHGNAIGRIDHQQLLYAQARGFSERDARVILIHAFFFEGCSQQLLSLCDTAYADTLRLYIQ